MTAYLLAFLFVTLWGLTIEFRVGRPHQKHQETEAGT